MTSLSKKHTAVQFTREQQQVIGTDLAPGQTLKIMAFAGTGKTTTLEAYTRKRPHVRFLYIAFNKGVQTEAAGRFPANVTARTVHSLAFRAKGFKYKDRLVTGFKANQVMSALGLARYEDARFAMDTLNHYLTSADPRVSSHHIPPAARAFYDSEHSPLPDLVTLANRLGRLMCDGSHPDIGMLHDGYLKLYQLSNPVLPADCILLDEAQDINPVTAALVLSQIRPPSQGNSGPASLILVGDSHQQIYSFRGARDSLSRVNATKTAYLTRSFRFDDNVAQVANMLLTTFKRETRQLVGTKVPEKPPWDPEAFTVIARTNAGLFDKAVSLISRHDIGFVGGVEGYRLSRIKDVFYLLDRSVNKVRDPYIRGFKAFEQLKSYARAVEDFDILSLCRIAEKYGPRLPVLVDRVSERAKATENASTGKRILLTTAHKAKGLEWPQVLLMDDFPSLIKEGHPVRPGDTDPDEFNLIYVAVTRAMTRLRFEKTCDIPQFIRYCLKHRFRGSRQPLSKAAGNPEDN